MQRKFFAAALAMLAAAAPCSAQEWATKMFTGGTSHDFGVVARGAVAQFRFPFKNIWEEDVHVVGIRSSCGCTSAHCTKPDLKTFQIGEIVADLNTRAFTGQRSATITVMFDKPFPAEAQLTVTGFIRSDVVVQPGEVDFGSIDNGSPTAKKVTVSYAGTKNWQIVGIKTSNPYLEAEAVETERVPGRVSYDLDVRLTKSAPAGYVHDQVTLATNDPAAPELAVPVLGRVVSEITVSPSSLFMGVVQPGQTVKKQLVVRGKKPFHIVDVKCDDQSFAVHASSEAKMVHLLPVVFTAGDTPGKITRQIAIETDEEGSATATFTAFAQVVSPDGAGEDEADQTPQEKK